MREKIIKAYGSSDNKGDASGGISEFDYGGIKER